MQSISQRDGRGRASLGRGSANAYAGSEPCPRSRRSSRRAGATSSSSRATTVRPGSISSGSSFGRAPCGRLPSSWPSGCERHSIEAVCGPLVEGAYVALMVAERLGVPFTYAERFDERRPRRALLRSLPGSGATSRGRARPTCRSRQRRRQRGLGGEGDVRRPARMRCGPGGDRHAGRARGACRAVRCGDRRSRSRRSSRCPTRSGQPPSARSARPASRCRGSRGLRSRHRRRSCRR